MQKCSLNIFLWEKGCYTCREATQHFMWHEAYCFFTLRVLQWKAIKGKKTCRMGGGGLIVPCTSTLSYVTPN